MSLLDNAIKLLADISEMVVHDFANCNHKNRPTVMQALSGREPPIESLLLGSTDNTEPTTDKVHIPRELIGEWATSDVDPFPDLEGLRKYAQQDKRVWEQLQKKVKPGDMHRVLSQQPWPCVDEITVEQMLKIHFDIVNLALEYTASPSGPIVMIAGGKSGTAGNKENNVRSIPDRASFFYVPTKFDNEGSPVYCFEKINHKGARKIENLLPGEIKIWYKFRREFLDGINSDPNTNDCPAEDTLSQAETVFTQIYQYMNERGAAIGYIITDQELICVRRIKKERYGVRYGVLDISPAIPLSVEDGNLNAKLALFYIHLKYIMKEPHLRDMPKTPKPKNWSQFVRAMLRARVPESVESRYKLRTASRGSPFNVTNMCETSY